MKEPSAPETVCCDEPERSLPSVTVAPGRAAPAGSTTLPRIWPAQAVIGSAKTKRVTMRTPGRAPPVKRCCTFIRTSRKGRGPLQNVSFVSPARKPRGGSPLQAKRGGLNVANGTGGQTDGG